MDQQQQTADDKERERLTVLKATAVRAAMFEVVGEQRDEIVRRARAKLTALGVALSDEDAEQL